VTSVSLLIHTSVPAWTRAVCEVSRPAVNEIVVAVDSRVPEDELGQLESLVDRLWRYEYADPPERVIAWLATQCSCEWLLRLDHDEVPSRGLLDALPRLVENDTLTHYWLLRRWPYPTAETYLDEPPWSPNRELRLLRNDPRFVRFPGKLHVTAQADGPGGWIDVAFYHFDLLVNDEAARRAKAERWERLLPGMRLNGRALNEGFYLPEHRVSCALAAVPDDDRDVLDGIVSGIDSEQAKPQRAVPLADRAAIDAAWPDRSFSADDYRGSIRLLGPAEPIVARERKLLEAWVQNGGGELWPWGRHGLPPIRLSYHWLSPAGETVVWNGVQTPMPHDVAPGDELVMPFTVEAPSPPGNYVLQLELVHEHRRWFGEAEPVPVRVSAARRVALLERVDPLDVLVDLSIELPELEVVRLPAREYLVGDRRSRAAMFLQLARRAPRLLWAIRKRRDEPLVAAILTESEHLRIVGSPRDRVDRAVESVIKRAARAAGCTIVG